MPAATTLRIDLTLDPRINLAAQQNAVPVIGEILLTNASDHALADLKVQVTLDPPIGSWEGRIDAIEAGSTHRLTDIDLKLSPAALREQTERVRGSIGVHVVAEEERIAEHQESIEVLAATEWRGIDRVPELLAAFVSPNDPAVEALLPAVGAKLQELTSDSALNGYQSRDPQRVAHIAAAVYAVLQARGLGYINPPASFERRGQKVRTHEQVLSARLGTCLDITVLAAALLEQCGVHPVMVAVDGHAFPGLWLSEFSLKEPFHDDPLPLRKRVDLKEALVFDSSSITQGRSFASACEVANRHLRDTDAFRFVVDVHAARMFDIRPLPLTAAGDDLDLPDPEGEEAPGEAEGVRLELLDDDEAVRVRDRSRVARWKDKLLDLTLRNSLLNFRPGKRAVSLAALDVGAIEDTLAVGHTLGVVPRPSRTSGRDEGLMETQTGIVLDDAWVQQRWDRGELVAQHTEADLAKRMLELYRYARSAMEETGTVSVYLAVGFMRWQQSASDRERLAPLLLVPITIERGTGTRPFRIQAAEDDTRVNITLLKLLEKDYGLVDTRLETLPEDEAGVDVPLVLQRFRKLVLPQPGWEVVETCSLAPFTFTKFLMWKDLEDNSELLLQNDVVRQIFHGGETAFPVVEPFLDESDLDAKNRPQDLLTVLDADPTQLSAIVGVSQGNSFVLQGPPGTGKSQTITNVIAQALAEGSTVLFVSEKMAALEVVHRRLAAVGLGPFCLELHSHKASKRSVIEQLRSARAAAGAAEPEQWLEQARSLEQHRDRLNEYAALLRGPSGFGPSAHGGLSALIGVREAPELTLDSQPLTRQRWLAVSGAITQLEVAGRDVPIPSRHPWRGCRRAEWSPRWQRELVDTLAKLEISGTKLSRATGEFTALIELPGGQDHSSLEALIRLAEAMATSPIPPRELVEGNQQAIEARIGEWSAQLEERSSLWGQLSARYETSLLERDLTALHGSFAKWADAFFLLAFFMLWSSRAAVKVFARTALASNATLLEDLTAARRIQGLDSRLTAAPAPDLLGRAWRGTDTEPGRVRELMEWAGRARRAVIAVAPLPDQRATRERLRGLVTEDATLFQVGNPANAALTAFQDAHQEYTELLRLAELELGPLGMTLDEVGSRARSATGNPEDLSAWCAWVRAATDARNHGLGPAVDQLEAGSLRIEDLGGAIRRALLMDWWEELLEREHKLARFRGTDHEALIARFGQLEADWTGIARALVRARIAKRIPDADAPGEMRILERELQKKRRHKPLRVLFRDVPTIIRALKPCMLMSPLSVAKYVAAGGEPFDLVVFDEASQIPPWDAIGAIARGRQVAVVGDSRQLPPTSFFSREDDDDGDEEDLEDLESILDEAIAARLPQLSLGWHYRSRHESLIAFSNHHYYDNRLNTFPSPEETVAGLGVQFRRVDGHYDRGRSRTNPREAQAIVEEVVQRLNDPDRASTSIGIVTFNSQQQRHIEDLLDLARQRHPAIEAFFTDAVLEPVFVKNLENVQGDERDVMMFSICYGPDAGGHITMNFGPLNRRGGERRLNVAVTRAREELLVFSTLTADHIRLSSTRSVGVKHLRAFLDYARRGPIAIQEAISVAPTEDTDSPFEDEVRAVLHARGWEVHTQVGCSGYRVDLGVVDPERPGRYLLGVECDGATYHSSANARARDRQRQGVLEYLGWTIHRVWSTDWWHRQSLEIDRLEAALEAAGRSPLAPRNQTNEQLVLPEPEEVQPVVQASRAPQNPPNAIPYESASVVLLGTSEQFYEPRARVQIAERLQAIVAVEGPVHVDRAARILVACWGMARVGRTLRNTIADALRVCPGVKRIGDFYWLADVALADWEFFRQPADGDRRSPAEIPAEEWAAAALWVVRRARSLSRDELERETAKLLGFAQLGRKVRAGAGRGVDHLVGRGAIAAEDGRIRLP